MYVPNYIPEPIEIPGNVSDAPWKVQLRFLRLFAAMVLGSLLLVLSFENIWSYQFAAYRTSLWSLAIWTSVSIVGLSLVRTFFRKSKWELLATIPIFLLVLDQIAKVSIELAKLGWPMNAALSGIFCATTYTFLCGRDFSFMGQWALSLICSSIGLAMWAVHFQWSGENASRVLALNFIFLTYFCADSARLMGRRKPSDVWLAVVDLFRDELNIFGYAIRCWKHWKRHQIFVVTTLRRNAIKNSKASD